MLKPIVVATALAGILDILAAVILTLLYGGLPADMLRRVASGPFLGAADWGAAGAALGLATHFALMAIMASAFVVAAAKVDWLVQRPIAAGALYGVVTYVAMNLVVVPLRWPEAFPPRPISVGTQLFCHIVLVGIPIALVAARYLRRVGAQAP